MYSKYLRNAFCRRSQLGPAEDSCEWTI
uniref:Uncharacterized protein n=1 Tax=Anguilla anguilla TaxID=7936 RepID=A0A0E9XR88_ANGAN